ncbi:MAG: LLM class flavin-dependent oxidoreductase, partial [Chloroflexota bacterium]
MNLGLFMMPLHPPTKPVAQCYDEDFELLVLADEVGFAEAWIGEHATMAWENIPAPDQFIARVYPWTKQIRFGTGVVLMAQH